jgi:amino acid adenylation domain-containing protein
VPFERLVEELQPERDLSKSPLFQVMFVLQNTPMPSLVLPSLNLQVVEFDVEIAQFDLVLDLTETSEGIEGCLEYSVDILDASSIAQMSKCFRCLLESIVHNGTGRISDLSLLTKDEQCEILVDWNDTNSDFLQDRCLHKLFEEQVERTPDAVAVVHSFDGSSASRHSKGGHLTYRELNRRANRLAAYLRGLGVGPEVCVGVCSERSLEMMVGILGVLKAGGAYLPLDPTYPEERLSVVLRDAQIAVLLTQGQMLERFHDLGITLVCLDSDWEKVVQGSTESLASGVISSNLAYIICTSGSTGAPKGILTTHQAASSRCVALAKKFRLEPDDRVLQFASISFDVSVEELYPTWIAGATLVLLPGRIIAPNWELGRLVENESLTVLNLPSSFWHEWVLELSTNSSALPSSLRMIIVGSERVSPERFTKWQALGTEHIGWINAYGPTETTVSCVHYGPDDLESVAGRCEVPVGRPLADTAVYVLDPYLQPSPVSVPGELYISGVGLARGYLNHPTLTAEHFIPDPFGNEPGARIYKTGDRGRYLPNGNIEFLGRVDRQVKIRGYRVETREVETVLERYPHIREVAVVASQDISDNTRLMAYVVPNGGSDDGECVEEWLEDLKVYLYKHLPRYMVPSSCVALNALPLTSTGKVDYLALMKLNQSELETARDFVPPRTFTEKALANIWIEVLGLEKVSIRDDFFSLGGHSLLATQVVSRMREAFEIELPLRRMLETRTIAGLASYIDTVRWAAQGPQTPIVILPDELEEGEL